ncbi:MAG: UDP-N-acetylenolpyruvoylglucosamine reductase [Pseudomonadota bacterium]
MAQSKLQGTLLLNESLARYNSWRVGGKAERVYLPAGLQDLQAFLQGLSENEPVHFIGLGSNLLVRDGGVRGTVIVMHNALNALEMQGDLLYADAGVTSAKVAKFSAKQGKRGAEFLAGIPGTVGGALAMNAGCHGGETWDIVNKVLTIDTCGKLHERGRKEFVATYRHVEMPSKNEWFIGAWFELPNGSAAEADLTIKNLLAKRLATQPLNLPNAGSTFRNPEGDYAARLIEACGLKGHRIGGAQVSEKHANFIVTSPGATAADVEQTIALMRDTVKEKFGIELQQEVRVIGEK